MKKLIAVCTTIALLATSAIPAVAQTTQIEEKTSLMVTSNATITDMLAVGENEQTKREDLIIPIATIEVLGEVYSKYLDDENKAIVESYINELKEIQKQPGEYLTEEESNNVFGYLFGAIILYSQVEETITYDQLLNDSIEIAKTELEKLDDCDLADYITQLLATDTTGMTDEEKENHAGTLLAVVTYSRANISFTVGDVDMDGKINSIDALTVLRNAVGMQEFEDPEMFLADTNKDSKITAIDALLIQRHVAGYPMDN